MNALRLLVIVLIVLCVVGIAVFTLPMVVSSLQQPAGVTAPSVTATSLPVVFAATSTLPPTQSSQSGEAALAAELLALLNMERVKAGLSAFDTPNALTLIANRAVRRDPNDLETMASGLEAEGMPAAGLAVYHVAGNGDARQIFSTWWGDTEFQKYILDAAYSAAAVGEAQENERSDILLVLAQPVSMTVPGTAVSGAGTVTTQEADIVALVNAARQAAGLNPLQINPRLTQAALLHSQDQASQQKLSHDGSDGSTIAERVRAQGFTFRAVGENVLEQPWLHAGSAFDNWWNSPGHRDNMMSPDFTEIGVAYSQSANGRYYYTMVLGTPFG